MLSQLLNGISLDLAPVAAIPIWDQYVTGLQHVLDFLASATHSSGLAVILFTIIIKTLLLPLTVKSIRSSKAMQELQPKIKELQKKHGKDRQKLSQETMAMYQKYQVNPLAGCLPMIVQIPIFFGVYRAISHLSNGTSNINPSEFWNGSFLWLENLATPDPYKILPILAGLFQFIQTRMSRPGGMGKSTDPQQAMMNTMMNFMPLMVVVFGWNFDSGPVIYWVTQSVYSVVQQFFIAGWGSMKDWFPWLPNLPEHRQLGYKPPRDLDDVIYESGEPAKRGKVMSWMQAKADEAQVQRSKMDELRNEKNGTVSGTASTKPGSKRPNVKSTRESDVIDVEEMPRVKPPRPIKKGSAKPRPAEPVVVETADVSIASPAPRKVKTGKRAPDKPPADAGPDADPALVPGPDAKHE